MGCCVNMQNKQSENASMSSEWLKTESKIAYSDLKSVISRQSFYLYLKKKSAVWESDIHSLMKRYVSVRMTVWPLYRKSPHNRWDPVIDNPPPESNCRTRCSFAWESPWSWMRDAGKKIWVRILNVERWVVGHMNRELKYHCINWYCKGLKKLQYLSWGWQRILQI